MGKKLLCVCLSVAMMLGMSTFLASAEYISQGDRWDSISCADNTYRYMHYKWSETEKPSHLNTKLQGYARISRNSDTKPTIKDYVARTDNWYSAGGIPPRSVSIVVGISAINVNKTETAKNEVYVIAEGISNSSSTNWTMFCTSQAIYTTATVEYYRVNNF